MADDPQFDWVKARHECSIYPIFKLLEADAEQNVKQRNSLKTSESAFGFKIEKPSAYMFIVIRMQNKGSRSIKFLCEEEQSHISVQNDKDEIFKARVTLDGEGGCKLKVGTDELERWQVLHKALESLFFD